MHGHLQGPGSVPRFCVNREAPGRRWMACSTVVRVDSARGTCVKPTGVHAEAVKATAAETREGRLRIAEEERTFFIYSLKAYFQRSVTQMSPGYRNQSALLSLIWSFIGMWDSVYITPPSQSLTLKVCLASWRMSPMCLRLHLGPCLLWWCLCSSNFASHCPCRLTALLLLMLCSWGRTLPGVLATQKGDGVLPCVKLCQERGLFLQWSCLGSMVLHFGDMAFSVLFILLSRASIQHWDNWARVVSNNSLCAEPRVITPFDPWVLLLSPACCAWIFLPLRRSFLPGTAQLLQFSIWYIFFLQIPFFQFVRRLSSNSLSRRFLRTLVSQDYWGLRGAVCPIPPICYIWPSSLAHL